MMRRTLILISMALITPLLSLATNESVRILSIDTTDGLVWSNSADGAQFHYQVEWAMSLDGEWQTNSPFVPFTTTSAVATQAVPFFYRVRWLNPPPYTLSGHVYFGPSDEPVSNAEVTLNSGNPYYVDLQTTISDTNGFFAFSSLSNATYRIEVTPPFPYLSEVSSSIIVDSAETAHDIHVPLPIDLYLPLDQSTTTNLFPSLQWSALPDSPTYQLTLWEHRSNTWSVIMYDLLSGTHTTPNDPLRPGCDYQWNVEAFKLRGSIPEGNYETIYVGRSESWSFSVTDSEP